MLGLVLPEAAAAQEATVTLTARPSVARYASAVQLTGAVAPAAEAVPVQLYRWNGSAWTLVAQGATAADGTYGFAMRASKPTAYIARAWLAGPSGPPTDSAQVPVRIRPVLRARVSGRRIVGARLVVSGRLLPARAGKVSVTFAKSKRRVRVGAAGRFKASFRAGVQRRVRVRVHVAPAPGYVRARRAVIVRLRRPALALGASGISVRALERRLWQLRYALRGVDSYYGYDTYEAMLAFQKVHWMPRTGRVGGSSWRALAASRVPRARVPRGDHIEVVKATQVLYEVRSGKVVRVAHVSTGATGNTPVGRWSVYRRHTGTNRLHMSYPMYFLRGFAIHGYPSVPPYPASHGCVRVPVWFAPGLYSRWPGLGVRIFVFP